MSKHTLEPWELIHQRGSSFYGSKGQNNDWAVFEKALEKDAARIVACVNTCAGMENPAEEIAKLRAERDQLLKALESIAELKPVNHSGREKCFAIAVKTAQTALYELSKGGQS